LRPLGCRDAGNARRHSEGSQSDEFLGHSASGHCRYGGNVSTWLLLIGVPVLVIGVVALIGLAPQWTHSGRIGTAARASTADATPRRPFSPRQEAELNRAMEHFEANSGLTLRVFVGDLTGGRQKAMALHAAVDEPRRTLLIAVDPALTQVEIVTGEQAGRALDKRQIGLAALAMSTAFGQGDLFGGLKRGIEQLGLQARPARVLHLDEPA